MTEKENYREVVINHKKGEWIPNMMGGAIAPCGGDLEQFENGPAGGGYDGFGVLWHCSDSGSGQPVPDSNHVVLDDVTAWEDKVSFPDVDKIDWKSMAEEQLINVNRGKQLVEYSAWNAQFLRVTHLLGFVEGLCAFVEEPEAVMALMDAITDYKIKALERIAEYFKPDIYTAYDDVATQFSLFMSPKTYRSMIKPQHKRVNDACKELGIIPMMHVCGKCEEIIPDLIEEGNVAWESAQPVNDIAGILDKYGDRISVVGGYDTNGRPGQMSATDAEVEAEVKRCMLEYGTKGSFALLGFRLSDSTEIQNVLSGIRPINAAAEKYKFL